LSLERDRPLSAEYPKAFRKSFPVKKAKAERAFRHAQTRAVAVGDDVVVRRRAVTKWKQATLGEVVAKKLERRAGVAVPRKSVAARTRRALRRRLRPRRGSRANRRGT